MIRRPVVLRVLVVVVVGQLLAAGVAAASLAPRHKETTRVSAASRSPDPTFIPAPDTGGTTVSTVPLVATSSAPVITGLPVVPHPTVVLPTVTLPPAPPARPADPERLGLYLVDAATGAARPVLVDWSFESVSFAPDGRRMVFAGRKGIDPPNGAVPTTLWWIDADGTNLTRLAVDATYPENPSWSPDGKWIAYYAGPVDSKGDEGLNILDVHSGGHHLLARVDQGRAPLEWSPDSTRIAIASPNHGTIAVADIASGQVTETAAPPGPIHPGFSTNSIYELSWSPDGNHLVASFMTGPVEITDALGRHPTVVNSSGRYARWSPSGALLSVWIDFSAYVQPVSGGPPQLVDQGSDPLNWSRVGSLIATEQGTRVVHVVDPVSGLHRTVVSETHFDVSVAAWSPVAPSFALVVERSAARRY